MNHMNVRNGSGYVDRTAHDALNNVVNEQNEDRKSAHRLQKIIESMIEKHGFLAGKIEVVSRKTEKKYTFRKDVVSRR